MGLGRPKGKGRTWLRGEPGFDAAVLGTSFSGRDPGLRPRIMVQANDVFDVIAAVLWLASDEAASVNGLALHLAGGEVS